MKFILLLISLLSLKLVFSQDKLIGTWKNEEKGMVVEIIKSNNHFSGKIISSKEDDLKPGHIFLTNILFNDEHKNYSGAVNMPSGITASCKINLLSLAKFQMTVTKLFITKTNTFIKIN